MEPMITISHYEMPLNLTLKYKGWYSRELIEFFEKSIVEPFLIDMQEK